MYCSSWPAVAGLGDALFVIDRSAEAVTGVSVVARLFWFTTSRTSEPTITSFSRMNPAGRFVSTVADTVTVAVSPFNNVPRLHLSWSIALPAAPVVQPPVPPRGRPAVKPVTTMPPGSRSIRTTFSAMPGPLFVTRIVQTIAPPAATGLGAALFVTARSASSVTSCSTVAESFDRSGSVFADWTAAKLLMLRASIGRTTILIVVCVKAASGPGSVHVIVTLLV
ncbi:MAG: hypothetical protein U0470_03850 [Anaerolineae bacterium]